jgi:amidase
MRKWGIGLVLAGILAGCSEAPARLQDGSGTQGAAEKSYAAPAPLSATLPDLSVALRTGETNSESLTRGYLDRIAEIDRAGPTLRSVLIVNPDALDQARASDARRARGESLGPLDGLPLLLKDNIETLDPMPTTAGALALKDNVTRRDSPLVAGLRGQGAVILGKTNLSQWANFRSNDSISGWSALGGQVRNPHILDRSPCGSSSGTGAAISAALAAGGVGTETNGSIICPSNVNGIVGFKPTVGLVPSKWIIPISPSQDTAGPMTRSVEGAAMMLNAMASSREVDFTAELSPTALAGKTVGVLRFAQGSNSDIIARFDAALADLEAAGATLVDITDFSPATEEFGAKALSVLQYEFKASLNAYLSAAGNRVPVRTLDALISFNRTHADEELVLFGQDLFEASDARGDLTDPAYLSARAAIQAATRQRGLDALLAETGADLLVAPSGPLAPPVDAINGDVWPDWAGAGYLAAIAGYPHLTVPMGQVRGIPIGLSLMAGHNRDADLLAYGYAYEQATRHIMAPAYLPSADAHATTGAAMTGLLAN